MDQFFNMISPLFVMVTQADEDNVFDDIHSRINALLELCKTSHELHFQYSRREDVSLIEKHLRAYNYLFSKINLDLCNEAHNAKTMINAGSNINSIMDKLEFVKAFSK